MNQATRAYVYRVLLALQPLVLFYGIASESEVALWLGVISAALGLGLATKNTSTKIEF